MATLDGSIVNVALPSIADSLGADIDTVAWVVLAYSLTLISLLLVFGAWTEQRGYLFAYRFGFIFFTLGSLACALAPNISTLIAARVIQATGTAMFAAVGPGMVTTVFPAAERGKRMGMMVMMVAGGFMVGPPLGGFMLRIWEWNSIFVINLPIGVAGIFLVHRYFKALKPPPLKRKINILGGISISAALVLLVASLSFVDQYPLSNIRIWGLAGASACCFVLFFRLERHSDTAVVGTGFFRNRSFMIAMGAALFNFMAFAGVSVLLPFYLERVKGLEPSQVGLLLIIIPILMFILSPLSGGVSDRIGYRALTSVGVAAVISGLYVFSLLDMSSSLAHIILALVVTGVGIGVFNTPNSSAMMGSVAPSKRAIASGLLATNRNIGISLGVAVGTTLFAYFQNVNAALGGDAEIFVASYRPVMYVSMGLAAIALILCLQRENRAETESPVERGEDVPDARP
jgi:EmrB/QacA subfamily drug resistance transporter